MCYSTIISTTAPLDLTCFDLGALRFKRVDEPVGPLAYPHRWLLRVGTCSCELRHMMASCLGGVPAFTRPLEWWPEDDADLRNTAHVAGALRSLVARGERVDCIDWFGHGSDSLPEVWHELVFDFDEHADDELRFVEDSHIELIKSS